MNYLFLPCILFCSFLYAQEKDTSYGAIITDRPDQTESPFLVPNKIVQLEVGFSYEETRKKQFQQKTFTYTSLLVRYGLLDNLELRMGLDIMESKTNHSFMAGGLSPLYVGFKIGIAEENGLLPQIGFLGGVFLPFTSADAFKPYGTGGEFRFAFSHTLSKKFDFSYNFGFSWDGYNPGVNYLYSTVLGYAVTKKLSAFIELYGDFPEHEESGHLVDGGFTYLFSENIQIDIAGGTGLTTNQDFFIGVGISVRLPN